MNCVKCTNYLLSVTRDAGEDSDPPEDKERRDLPTGTPPVGVRVFGDSRGMDVTGGDGVATDGILLDPDLSCMDVSLSLIHI